MVDVGIWREGVGHTSCCSSCTMFNVIRFRLCFDIWGHGFLKLTVGSFPVIGLDSKQLHWHAFPNLVRWSNIVISCLIRSSTAVVNCLSPHPVSGGQSSRTPQQKDIPSRDFRECFVQNVQCLTHRSRECWV